jgi:DNA-binding MarR family transcriptional regulator
MTELTELTELNYSSIGWTVARLARQVEVALATLELSPAQYRMLVQIARGTDASSSLAQKLAVSAPSVTSVVEALVQRGAVERAHSAADRRRIALALSEYGRDLLGSAEAALQERLQGIADELADEALVTGAMSAMSIWGDALDRARARRHAQRAGEVGDQS